MSKQTHYRGWYPWDVDVAKSLPKVPCPWREIARNWRTSSMTRAAKLGTTLVNVPTIDEVHTDLLQRAKVCIYCGCEVNLTKKRRLNLDHVIPICRGGDASLENMVIACAVCNRVKGDLTAQEFRELRTTVSQWEDKGKSLFIRLRLGFFRP